MIFENNRHVEAGKMFWMKRSSNCKIKITSMIHVTSQNVAKYLKSWLNVIIIEYTIFIINTIVNTVSRYVIIQFQHYLLTKNDCKTILYVTECRKASQNISDCYNLCKNLKVINHFLLPYFAIYFHKNFDWLSQNVTKCHKMYDNSYATGIHEVFLIQIRPFIDIIDK